MGFGMVSNLLKGDYGVLIYDTHPEKITEAVAKGADKAENVEEIATMVETVILCLPHPGISKEVISKLMAGSSKVATIIDTSTLNPQTSKEIHTALQAKNIKFLCDPMLGGKVAADNKQIHFLVEGEKDIFEENKHLFDAMGMQSDYMGDIPNATLAKLAYNICRYGNVAIAAEVARFVRKYSQDTKAIYNLLAEGSLDNFGQVWAEDIQEMMLSGIPYKPSKIPQKDLSLIIELAKEEGLSDTLFEAIKETYKSLES